jgi:hypothetical protein
VHNSADFHQWNDRDAGDNEPNHGGPVQIAIEYIIAPNDRNAFLAAIYEFSAERLRDGAYDSDIYEDAAEPDRMTETFLVPSWLEHQRQHRRVTSTDRDVQVRMLRFHRGTSPPVVRHLVAVRPMQGGQ